MKKERSIRKRDGGMERWNSRRDEEALEKQRREDIRGRKGRRGWRRRNGENKGGDRKRHMERRDRNKEWRRKETRKEVLVEGKEIEKKDQREERSAEGEEDRRRKGLYELPVSVFPRTTLQYTRQPRGQRNTTREGQPNYTLRTRLKVYVN
ncbi:MAG: hypothetical protein ACK5KT_11850 [Dysgonomonas sp.]